MSEKEAESNPNIVQFNQFLQNNNELLLEKYREYFVVDSLPISSIDPDTVVKFINDVFSFDRYDKTDVRQTISTSLKDNFRQFKQQNKAITKFTSKVAIDLLKFCIQNNQMFAVKYEKQHSKQRRNSPEGNPDVNPEQSHSPEKQNMQFNDGHTPQMEQDSAADSNLNRSVLSNQFAEAGVRRVNSFIENQFEFHENIKLDFDPVLIKKNTIIMFEYYCKQQMALKPNLSFERIEAQSKTLTLSKFLLMARMMNIMNSLLNKQMLTGKFRAVSQGKNGIDIKKFQILINQLQVLDPSLIARAELNSPNIQAHLKTTKKPFDTQDTNPRELVRNRPFAHKLTMHSGKMQQDLIAQLQNKKSQMLSDRQVRMRKYEEIVSNTKSRYKNLEESVISTKNLVRGNRRLSSDLGIVKHIVNEKDDDKYLKQYKIKLPPKPQRSTIIEKSERSSVMIKQLKNRIRQLQKTQQESSSMDETRPLLYSPKSPKKL